MIPVVVLESPFIGMIFGLSSTVFIKLNFLEDLFEDTLTLWWRMTNLSIDNNTAEYPIDSVLNWKIMVHLHIYLTHLSGSRKRLPNKYNIQMKQNTQNWHIV